MMKTMKKILVLMIAVFAMSMTANAQWNETSNRAYHNIINRMAPVDKKYCITTTPIVLWENFGIYGRKDLPGGYPERVGPFGVVKSPIDIETMCDIMNKHAKKTLFTIATTSQIHEAHNKVGLHGEASQTSTVTNGFFITMPYKDWLKLKTK